MRRVQNNALESIFRRYSLYQRLERGFSLRIQLSFLPYRAHLFIQRGGLAYREGDTIEPALLTAG